VTVLRDKEIVRIPLDYYRILGLPIQATPQQLEQAYCDRTVQLPRREYSDSAIQSRKQLLEEAYQILSNPEKRKEYDLKFLEQTYDAEGSKPEVPTPEAEESEESKVQPQPAKEKGIDSYSSYIEITPQQFLGALLILQELGEYELVLQLAEPHLVSKKIQNDQVQNREDIVLVTTLSYLELARELWQQREYEKAATYGKIGLELLYQEELFLNVQKEIKNDLYKLRPYRILELVNQPLDRVIERNKGIQLLQEMLDDRQGIDGKGNDRSGLNIEDFLQFIQQLRKSLTAEEQQEFFEMEAQRPSAVAGYLAVYALIARGFHEKRPAFIVRAEEILIDLGQRQDIYLEQAICALLLGKTEEINDLLECSQDNKSLRFIQEKSQGSVDLLPGLCVYTENWLKNEVFPHFRDLIGKNVVLDEYFADNLVQSYLERIYPNYQGETSFFRSQVQQLKNTFEKVTSGQYGANYLGSKAQSLESVNTNLDESKEKSEATSLTAFKGNKKKTLTGNQTKKTPKIRKKQRDLNLSPRTKSLLVILGFGLLAIGVLALSQKLFPKEEELELYLNKPLIEMPMVDNNRPEDLLQSSQKLDRELAEIIVKTWLNSKAESFGKEHQMEGMANILSPSLLKQWRSRAENLRNNKSYYEYQHEIKVISVQSDPQKPLSGTIEAEVKESAKFYRDGKGNNSKSYDDDLLINYGVEKMDDRWVITGINLVR
jgi:curved DNA-binding protein CbpA